MTTPNSGASGQTSYVQVEDVDLSVNSTEGDRECSHGEDHPCPHCGVRFDRKAKLTNHQRRCQGEPIVSVDTNDSSPRVMCGHCRDYFSTQNELKQHLENASKDGELRCRCCQRRWLALPCYMEHIRDKPKHFRDHLLLEPRCRKAPFSPETNNCPLRRKLLKQLEISRTTVSENTDQKEEEMMNSPRQHSRKRTASQRGDVQQDSPKRRRAHSERPVTDADEDSDIEILAGSFDQFKPPQKAKRGKKIPEHYHDRKKKHGKKHRLPVVSSVPPRGKKRRFSSRPSEENSPRVSRARNRQARGTHAPFGSPHNMQLGVQRTVVKRRNPAAGRVTCIVHHYGFGCLQPKNKARLGAPYFAGLCGLNLSYRQHSQLKQCLMLDNIEGTLEAFLVHTVSSIRRNTIDFREMANDMRQATNETGHAWNYDHMRHWYPGNQTEIESYLNEHGKEREFSVMMSYLFGMKATAIRKKSLPPLTKSALEFGIQFANFLENGADQFVIGASRRAFADACEVYCSIFRHYGMDNELVEACEKMLSFLDVSSHAAPKEMHLYSQYFRVIIRTGQYERAVSELNKMKDMDMCYDGCTRENMLYLLKNAEWTSLICIGLHRHREALQTIKVGILGHRLLFEEVTQIRLRGALRYAFLNWLVNDQLELKVLTYWEAIELRNLEVYKFMYLLLAEDKESRIVVYNDLKLLFLHFSPQLKKDYNYELMLQVVECYFQRYITEDQVGMEPPHKKRRVEI